MTESVTPFNNPYFRVINGDLDPFFDAFPTATEADREIAAKFVETMRLNPKMKEPYTFFLMMLCVEAGWPFDSEVSNTPDIRTALIDAIKGDSAAIDKLNEMMI